MAVGEEGSPCSDGALIEVCSVCVLPAGRGDSSPAFTNSMGGLVFFRSRESPANVLCDFFSAVPCGLRVTATEGHGQGSVLSKHLPLSCLGIPVACFSSLLHLFL